MKRFNERQWRDCDGDWFSTGMEETSNGKWCLFSEVEKQNELLKEMAEALHELLTKVARYGYDFQLEAEFEEGKVIMQKYHEQEGSSER